MRGCANGTEEGMDKAWCAVFHRHVISRFRLLPPAIALLAGSLCAAPAPKPDPLYETRADHDPNGIGTFYMGREIAHVMGPRLRIGWSGRSARRRRRRTR
jgi:hypothetical protein